MDYSKMNDLLFIIRSYKQQNVFFLSLKFVVVEFTFTLKLSSQINPCRNKHFLGGRGTKCLNDSSQIQIDILSSFTGQTIYFKMTRNLLKALLAKFEV